MAEKYKKPTKDTWVRDYAGTNKKVDAYIKSQGGNEWDVAGFRQYMDYHSARQKQSDESNSKAVSSWNTAHEESYKKQQEKEAKSLKEQIKKSEEQRKKRAQQNKSLVPQISSKKKEERNGFQKVMDTINSPLKAIDKAVLQPAERLATSFTDGLLLNQVKKNVTKNNAPSFVQKASEKPKTTVDKVIDTAGEFAGMVAPISASYKIASPLVKPLAKVLPQVGKLGTASKLLQTSVRGGTAMGVYGTAREGLDEAIHPKDATFEDRAKRVRNDAIAGAVLDPAFSVGGMALKKGFESASNRAMRNLLPKQEQVQQTLLDSVKTFKGEQSLPMPGGVSTPLNELIPRGNDIANPSYIPSLTPKPKPQVVVPKVGTPLEEALANPRPDIPEVPQVVPQTKVDTSQIEKEIENVTRQLEQAKNQPKSKTKTEIDDALRSLDINDAYLTSSRQKGKITNEEYHQKIQENERNREALLNESKAYSQDVADEFKTSWNNETRAYEIGDYSAKKAYGGGYSVKKGTETVGKFRTEEEAKHFMQQSVAKEKGIDLTFDKEGILTWKSTYDEANKKWDIQAGDYTIHKGGKDSWTVKKGEKTVGTYKSEKKAREEAQRHFDKQPKSNEQTTALEKQLNELNNKRQSITNPPKPTQSIDDELAQFFRDNPNPQDRQLQPLEEQVTAQETPVKEPKKSNERSFYNTVQNPEKLSPELKAKLEEFDKTYKPMSNQELVDYANAYVTNDLEKAYQFVKNAKKFDPRHITVGHRLIDELQKAGQFDRALDVVERLAEQGTKAGQSIQSYSIYNRLTAEGQLLRAQRHVNKINENITDPAKQVKLTEQTIQDIIHTTEGIQKFAGQLEQAKTVETIMDSIKKGNIATDAELETVRSFVTDAKKFLGDLDPKAQPPRVKTPKDVRTRDKVVDFMDKKEEVARQELRKIFGRANSLPVDAFYHLSVIGASKVAKGTVKLSDFTEEMVKEFGEMVRPYAKQIYNKAVETFNLQSESMTAKRLSEVEKITNKALKDKNLDVDQADAIREFARQVGRMSGDAKLESSMELQTILQSLDRPTFGQKLAATQTIAQLLNLKTIARNAIGNELFYRTEQLNKIIATPIDIARSKLTGGERTVTFRSNNQGQYWKNWFVGGKAGWKGVNPMGLQTAYDLGPQAFRSKWNPLTYLEKSLGATLRSFDHAGYMRAYNSTLGEMATLRAINERLTGSAKKEAIAKYIREADANMMNMADQYGKYATFQDNTVISNALQKVKKGLNFGKDFGMGDLIVKYPKTPDL